MLINSNPSINNNNGQFPNKPLNNYNPNLAKKNTNTSYKPQHNHLNNPNNNHSNPNLFNRKNRPNTPNGPMKGPIRIKNDNSSSLIKKPTTPDTLSRLNKTTHSMYNNPIQRPSSVKKKQVPSSNHHDIPHSRPSTAPHKDKLGQNPMSRSNNTMINPNMRQHMMPDNSKRLPSPQIHSNNTLSKTQKVNQARYRAPSPVVKSTGNSAMMLGGTMKKGSYVYGKF